MEGVPAVIHLQFGANFMIVAVAKLSGRRAKLERDSELTNPKGVPAHVTTYTHSILTVLDERTLHRQYSSYIWLSFCHTVKDPICCVVSTASCGLGLDQADINL